MPHFVKTGFWERAQKGALGWLNLERLITDISAGTYVQVVNSLESATDSTTVDLTSTKETLTSDESAITFTLAYVGDDITLEVILNTTAATYTFPSNSLCVSEGVATGNNILDLAGASGDHYIIGIKNMGTTYYIVAKNFGQ